MYSGERLVEGAAVGVANVANCSSGRSLPNVHHVSTSSLPAYFHAYTHPHMLAHSRLRVVSMTLRTGGISAHLHRGVSTAPPAVKPSMKHPTRGGQNLTARYGRLEKSVRGKDTYQREITGLVEDAATLAPHGMRSSVRTFMGYVVPEEPKAPASEGQYCI